MSIQERIPVTVLTGFLGSGKTTLLNRILTESHGQRIAVIENEFGEIGVDQELVINAEEEIFEMNNGCICCTVRGDLIRILGNLIARRDRFDRVVLETTGLANPGPVAQTFFVDDSVRGSFALDGIVTLIDAAHFEQQLADSQETHTQVAFADIILINKTDLASEKQVAALEKRVRGMNAMARIVRAPRDVRAGVAMDSILGIGGFDLARALEYQPRFLEPEYPFEWAGLYDLKPGPVVLQLSPGPDPSMKVVFVPAGAQVAKEPREAAEQVFQAFSGSIEEARADAALAPELRARELEIKNQGESRYTLQVSEAGSYWLFTQHLPAEFDLQVLTAAGAPLNPRVERDFAPGHTHDSRVASFSIEDVRPVNPKRFESWIASVQKEQGTRLYRLKGFVNFEDRDDRIVLQGVHMSLDASSLGPWGDRPRRTQLVFIGRDLDTDSLRSGFETCLA
jgi:G3E family GTPase